MEVRERECAYPIRALEYTTVGRRQTYHLSLTRIFSAAASCDEGFSDLVCFDTRVVTW